jgi:DNA-binding response OmpR family regulator
MAKILVVDDDLQICEKLREWLESQHHLVETVNEGLDAAELLRSAEYELVILDWDLPGKSGIEILSELRGHGSTTPVLMLTGKDELADIERGLHGGADDYLIKPFAMRELAARVVALTRRAARTYEGPLRAGSVELDVQAHKAFVDGQEVKLQPQEFALLEFLLRNRTHVFSVEALMQRVWASDTEASPDTVRVCITRLRSKIGSPGKPSVIKTVHRLGYQIDPDA